MFTLVRAFDDGPHFYYFQQIKWQESNLPMMRELCQSSIKSNSDDFVVHKDTYICIQQ